MQENYVEKHTWVESIIYHIFPGIFIGIFYFLVRAPLINNGFPSIFALMLAVVFVLIPIQLGFLLYQGKKSTGKYTLKGVIKYWKPISFWQAVLWVVGVFIVVGLIFTLLKPVDHFLKSSLFFWIPDLQSGLEPGFEKSKLILTYLFVFVFGAVLGPLTEEFYFRGYLLPRVPGKASLLFHSFLFALYHVFTPWMIITRTLGMLPLAYAVKKKSLVIGIIVHVLVNSIDVITGIVFISALP